MAKPKKVTYDTNKVLQLAILVDRNQGFIKSGFGFYDHNSKTATHDNKTAIMRILDGTDLMPAIPDDVVADAAKITNSFKEELVGKKLMNKINSFEESVLGTLSNDETEAFGISILASLPNSFRVQGKRQELDDFFDAHRATSEFVGAIGDRLRFDVEVKDVKFIAKFGIHLVTCVNNDGNIVKFFFNREPDIGGLIEGKKMVLTGKVKTHDVSKFSQCKETVLNYVKIE
jgi:hypothetical protein